MNKYLRCSLWFFFQNDDNVFVTGSVSGLVTIQKSSKPMEEPRGKRVPFRYVSDTLAKGNDTIDTVVIPLKKDKLAKYDQALRKFQYSKALDCVMTNPIAFKMPAVVVTVFDELIRYLRNLIYEFWTWTFWYYRNFFIYVDVKDYTMLYQNGIQKS